MIETIPAVTQMSCDYCNAVRREDQTFITLMVDGYCDCAVLTIAQVDKQDQVISEARSSKDDDLHFCSAQCAGEYVKEWAQSVMNIKQD